MAHGHDHVDSHGSAEAAGAASWMVAMVAFLVLAFALVVAMFVWAPWDDDDTGGGGNVPGENVDDGENIDIEGDIDINGGDAEGGDSGEQPQQ